MELFKNLSKLFWELLKLAGLLTVLVLAVTTLIRTI